MEGNLQRRKGEVPLRDRGRRLTRQRVVICGVLAAQADAHLSAEEVAERVRQALPDVNASTVYRTLDLLVEEGLVRRTDLGQGRAYYEPAHERYLDLHRGHLIFVRPDEAHLVTGDLIEATTMSGTVDQLRERLRHVAAAGYDEIVVGITPGHDSMIEEWMEVFDGL